MIIADRSNDRYKRIANHIGRIISAAHGDFQHRKINLFLPEPEKAHHRADSHHAEIAGFDHIHMLIYITQEYVLRDPLIIDADPITDVFQMR